MYAACFKIANQSMVWILSPVNCRMHIFADQETWEDNYSIMSEGTMPTPSIRRACYQHMTMCQNAIVLKKDEFKSNFVWKDKLNILIPPTQTYPMSVSPVDCDALV